MSRPTTPARDGGPPPGRGLYCNRTLNLRAIRAIGFDMDYTLVHYRVHDWEEKAYAYLKQKLTDMGWPVQGLEYDTALTMRGLVIDTALGNIVKADRFGYVKRAYHGTAPLTFEQQRQHYGRTLVDLADPRWLFLNTFFSLSEACMYAQLVDRLDHRRFETVLGYQDLLVAVHRALDDTHAEGRLKQEILQEPERYIERDPDVVLTLLDQKESGKRLLLITNSDWDYVQRVLSYAFDPYIPRGGTWRDLFELVVVSAHKPLFFSTEQPMFQMNTADGLLHPIGDGLTARAVYVGGHAANVEQYLGLSGSEILYVGDHLYTDVRISKDVLRWRTALVLRELEDELAELARVGDDEQRLEQLMADKTALEWEFARARLALQRRERQYGPQPAESREQLERRIGEIRSRLDGLDARIAPLATGLSRVFNPIWGPLMRTGNDKSHLARQVERYADIYTSRVSNFLFETPFAYLRSPRGSLPHDP